MRPTLVRSFLAVCLLAPAAASQEPPRGPVVLEGTGQEVHELLSAFERHGLSLAVSVVMPEGIVLQRGYGLARVDPPLEFGTATPFFLASLAKQFFATAILALMMDGELDPDASLAEYVPDVPEDKRAIRVRHLLKHMSGLANFELEPERELSLRERRDTFVREALSRPLVSVPGEEFSYSNAGYSLLAAIVEHVSGVSLADYMRERVFLPAGMTSTGLITEERRWDPATVCHGYSGEIHQGDVLLASRRPFGWTISIAILTTIEDMGRWELALRSNAVLSPEATGELFAPNADGYACGWNVFRSGGRLTCGHDGFILPDGFNCYFLRYPEEERAVVVFANDGDRPAAETVAGILARFLDGEPVPRPEPPVELDPAVLEGLVGGYETEEGDASLELWLEADRLRARPEGQRVVDLLLDAGPADHGRFVEATGSTGLLLEAMALDEFDGVEAHLTTGRGPADWVRRLRRSWKGLEDRFGPLEDFTLLHAVPEGPNGFLQRAYVRARFERGSPALAFDWQGAQLFGFTDHLAFLNAPDKTVRPGRPRLVPVSPSRLVAFDPLTGAETTVDVGPEGLLVKGARAQALRLRRR